MGLLITACGVPVYLVTIRWRDKPLWFQNLLCKLHHLPPVTLAFTPAFTCPHLAPNFHPNISDSLGYTSQKMFLGLKEDLED